MLIVSNIIDTVQTLLPPRAQFQLDLRRLDRWKTFEHGYHLLPMLVDPNRAAIDVGANEGYYAGKMARYTDTVYCFEPIPWLVEMLERKLPRKVRIHHAAVSDTAGQATLRIPYNGSIEQHGTTTIEPKNALDDVDSIKEIQCETVTLDDAVTEPVGFIKIDVEGHEMAVLRGAERIISMHRPIFLLESERRHFPEAPENVFRFFAEHGYEAKALFDTKILGLQGFDAETHQAPDRHGRHYVNNFLFFPTLQSMS